MIIFRLYRSRLQQFLCGLGLLTIVLGCRPDLPPVQRPLTGNWQFKALDSTAWLPATVPGVVHTDLLALGKIPDPFTGRHEAAVQGLAENQWEYRLTFNLTKEELRYPQIDLVFAGLDTYAEVWLNGQHVLSANNMFRKWRLKVKETLVAGANSLKVVFTPPVMANKQKLAALPYTLPAGAETGKWQVSPFTRKAPYQFGWDFAPRLVTMGIWQPVYLHFWPTARIEDVTFTLNYLTDEEAGYTVHLAVYAAQDNSKCTLKVRNATQEITLREGYNNTAIDIAIPDPKLWWPNGWGEANLYAIPVTLRHNGMVIDSLTKRLGVRTVELVQDFDSVGRSFYVRVNNKPVFIKGANWTPLSSFPSAVPDSVYCNRLEAVQAANMNMLRVWGGGIYERDLFYDLCDAKGILVWQDFMFANSMYPGDAAFYANVREEVKQQVKRLQTHPSLAFWNGNNEIEVAWKNWGWQQQYGYTAGDSAKIWQDYQYLFRQLIPEIIALFDPGRAYTPTSPLSNWGRPENFSSGSMHYWGVWHGPDDFPDFRTNVGRFMAEYGFQAYPDTATVAFYTDALADVFTSPDLAHQKSYVGNKLLVAQATKYFGKPAGAEDFIAKSQQTQALALKMAIEAHRLAKPVCGGTLFWQLNDCWPGPSWAVVDYFGRPKLAWEVIKDRYQPVILVVSADRKAFSIEVVNDLQDEVNGRLQLALWDAAGTRHWVTGKDISLGANRVKSIYRSQVNKLLDGRPAAQVYLKATLFIDGQPADVETFYFVPPKDFQGSYTMVGE